MSHLPLVRLAGPIALAAGALLLVQQLVMLPIVDRGNVAATMAHPLYLASALTYFIAFCALLAALVAAYARQQRESGYFGVVAFLAAAVGTMFLVGDLWFEAFAVPWLGDVAPEVFAAPAGTLVAGALASYVLFAAGWILFGLASLRARVFPRLISLGIVLGGVIGFQAALPPFAIPLAIAIGSLGVWMLRTTPVGQASAGKAEVMAMTSSAAK